MTGEPAPAYRALFEPYSLRHLTLRNRIISTPHGPAYAEDGMPGERYQRYHEEKARGGIAMTMFGGSSNISIDSPSLFGQLYMGDDRIIPHLREFSERIHSHGAALMCQITHMGHRTVWNHGDWLVPIAPSHTRDKAHRAFPKAMEKSDIERVIADFGQAARRCREGGLDGCEVSVFSHLANQFLTPAINKRTDEYGGSLENRLRFTLEALAEVRRQVGDDYIVGLRFPADERLQGWLSEEECIEAARHLADSGLVDFFNIWMGTPATNWSFPDTIPAMTHAFGPFIETAARFKRAVALPVFHSARMHDPAIAERALREGAMDLIGMTRGQMADPWLVSKLRRGEESRIRPCVGSNYCIDRIYQGGDALCLHNPATGREQTMPHIITPGSGGRLKVVVVGGGPGGLEAARVCALRGHDVVLFEASNQLGGQLAIAARASWRRDLIGFLRWLADEVRHLEVDIRYNTFAEAAEVLAADPDVVIVATGGLPDTAVCEGSDLVSNVWEALTGQTQAGKDVLVFDDHGDHQALSCAQALAEDGANVELITPDRTVGEELGISNAAIYFAGFADLGIRTTVNTRLLEVSRTGDRLSALVKNDYGGKEQSRIVDTVVVEHGVVPLEDVYFDLKSGSTNHGEVDLDELASGRLVDIDRNPGGNYRLYRVGDAVASRNLHAALFDSLRICSRL
jgi:2,4-dienoyl-CoA reductase-like NADH-dependent reductase (Old Yellow Enzyme family)/NADPH-dependent 2,4-dienoyl-CoA reductase/sulfur reductase-like enzyme